MSIFLDTGVLLAYIVPQELRHDAAMGVLGEVAGREHGAAYTSDYVLAEALNFLRAKVARAEYEDALAGAVFGTAAARPIVKDVLRVHGSRFAASLEAFRRHRDRRLSFTDCTSLVLVRELGIDRIATFDGGFRGLAQTVP